ERAGVNFLKEQEQINLGSYIFVESVDEYQVVLAFAEIDPAFSSQEILLADKKNGRAIESPEGPFRLIVPSDKRRGRWVKQVFGVYVVRSASWPPVAPPR